MEWGFKTAVGVLLTVVGFCVVYAINQIGDLQDITTEHEVRISKREANAFTSQDANKLLLAVSQLNFQVAQQQKDLDARKQQDDELLDQMRKWEAKSTVLPADVLKEVKALREELKRQ